MIEGKASFDHSILVRDFLFAIIFNSGRWSLYMFFWNSITITSFDQKVPHSKCSRFILQKGYKWFLNSCRSVRVCLKLFQNVSKCPQTFVLIQNGWKYQCLYRSGSERFRIQWRRGHWRHALINWIQVCARVEIQNSVDDTKLEFKHKTKNIVFSERTATTFLVLLRFGNFVFRIVIGLFNLKSCVFGPF